MTGKKLKEMYTNYKIPMNQGGFHFPIKILDADDFVLDDGCIEIERGPAGCMLLKREAIERMIAYYPELKVRQNHLINETAKSFEHSYNFWDTEFNKETGQIIGEDFAFCDRFRKAGGRIYAYVESMITHHGNYPFKARFIDECAKIR
jgi:GT2 family glycosyltransferase